jgi:2-oxoacid:acceptor oxidoreductase delta subunit (pyruvate/2-ketoisovalerate family)
LSTERRIHPIVRPKAGIAGRTSEWRSQRPEIELESCTKCLKCVIHCPDDCIILNDEGYPVIDQFYCKGCMICEAVCPHDAIFEIITLPGGDKDA